MKKVVTILIILVLHSGVARAEVKFDKPGAVSSGTSPTLVPSNPQKQSQGLVALSQPSIVVHHGCGPKLCPPTTKVTFMAEKTEVCHQYRARLSMTENQEAIEIYDLNPGCKDSEEADGSGVYVESGKAVGNWSKTDSGHIWVELVVNPVPSAIGSNKISPPKTSNGGGIKIINPIFVTKAYHP